MALPQQLATWRIALDTSPLPSFIVGDDAELVFANQAARLAFRPAPAGPNGGDWRAGEIIGCVEAERPGGCGRQDNCAFCVLRGSVGEALEGKPVRRELARLTLRDGEGQPRDRNFRVSALSATEGLARHALLVLEQAADHESEVRLLLELQATRALLDAVPIPVFAKSPNRRYVYVNQQAARLLGREAAAVVGKTDADFFSPEAVAALWAEDDRVLLHGESLEHEEEVAGLAGGRRTVVVRKGLGTDADGEPLVLSTRTDITDLKRTQRELEESQRRLGDSLATLRGVVESSDAAIFAVDRLYRYTCFNGAHAAVMRRIYGVDIELGSPLSRYQTVAEDWATARANLDRVLAGEAFVAESYSGEVGRARRFFEVNHAPVRDAAGAVIGAAVFARDVTERRQSQEALHQSEERLRQAQKMEAVGRLAGGVAHDFNNILTVIMASVEFGLAEASADSPLRVELEEIRGAGLRAQALTHQLLAFSRRQVLQPQVVDLNAKIHDLERMLRRLLGEDVEVRSSLQPGLRRVFIDPGQLEQVILNLAVNARDAMPAGGTLGIETADVELDAAHAERHTDATPGPQVMLAISDTGQGIDPDTLPRVFEPFFTTKPDGKGTGLGLATVYGIVKQSGGSIWVYSEPGRGTTVKVYLPRAAPAGEAEAAVPVAARQRARPGERVLVVEDDEQVRRAAVQSLERLGYQVAEASGLADAVRVVAQGGTFSALLTDVIMPGGGGVEVARVVSERSRDLAVVFMSGYTDEAIAQHGVLAPGAHFLEKPFTPESLGRRIREALDRGRTAEA